MRPVIIRKIEWSEPGKSPQVHIYEDGKERGNVRNVIFLADAESGEILYLENLPEGWIKNLIKDSKIKIFNPSERN